MSKQSAGSDLSSKALYIAAVVILALAVLTAAFVYHHAGGYLVLSSEKTGSVYARYKVHNSDTFSIGFIHSVNKSPVRDYYQCRDGEIWNTRCVYYGFGAGVGEILLDGETLSYGDNGEMIVSGIDHRIDPMILVVGTISDHTLYLANETVSLRDLCGRSSKVLFTVTQG